MNQRRTSERFRRFLQKVVETGDPVESAKFAGYSDKGRNLSVQASRMMKHPAVQEALEKFHNRMLDNAKEAIEENGMSVPEIQDRIAHLARNGKTEQTKLRALELAARVNGMMSERHIIEGKAETQLSLIVAPWRELPEPEIVDVETSEKAEMEPP